MGEPFGTILSYTPEELRSWIDFEKTKTVLSRSKSDVAHEWTSFEINDKSKNFKFWRRFGKWLVLNYSRKCKSLALRVPQCKLRVDIMWNHNLIWKFLRSLKILKYDNLPELNHDSKWGPSQEKRTPNSLHV